MPAMHLDPALPEAKIAQIYASMPYVGSHHYQAIEVTPRLFLSGLFIPNYSPALKDMQITHVVSVTELPLESLRPPLSSRSGLTLKGTLHIDAEDVDEQDLLEHFERANKFIKDALSDDENNRVLVHCKGGVSRSPTIVAAYLVSEQGMAGEDALAHLQKIRPIVCPNASFRAQLAAYELQLHPKTQQPSIWSQLNTVLGIKS